MISVRVLIQVHILRFLRFYSASQVRALPDNFLIDMVLGVRQLLDGLVDDELETVLPGGIQFFELLVSRDAVLRQVGDEVLGSFRVLFRDQSLVFNVGLTVFFRLFVVALGSHRAEDRRCGQDLVEVLELLSGALLVRVCRGPLVDFSHVREPVDDKGSQKNRVRDFVVLDREGSQGSEGLELANLYETVDVVVLEE
jgi:hypothetical protein